MIYIIIIIGLIIDLVSKYIISSNMYVNESISVIDNFFRVTYVKNTGGAFSVFNDNFLLVKILSILIIIFILWYLYKNKINNNSEAISYGMILGGSIGNLYDRLFLGYVRDFLSFNFFGYEYPIFNVADMLIVIGVVLMIIITWRRDRNGIHC